MVEGAMVLMTVTDIEFLSNFEPQNASCSIYIYHSGRLLSQVKSRVRRNADSEGLLSMSCEPQDLVAAAGGGSLFRGLHVCNWSRSPAPKATLKRLREVMLTGSEEHIFLFGRRRDFSPEDIVALQNDKWLLIEEKAVGSRQLSKALRLFCETSDLEGADKLYLDAGFQRYFESFIDQDGQQSIADFANEFDRAVLLHSDRSGMFDGEAANRSRHTRTQLAQSIQNLIRTRDDDWLTHFVSNVSVTRRRGAADGDLIEHLRRAVTDLIGRQNVATTLSYLERRDLMLFMALFITSIPKLKSAARRNVDVNADADDLMVLVDQIGRQFQQMAIAGGTDPFESSWYLREHQTQQMFREDHAALRRLLEEAINFVEASAAHLQVPWISRFYRLCTCCRNLQDAVHSGEENLIDTERDDPVPYLGQILDQDVIVRSLQRSLLKTDHDAPILLYGTDNVRKREIARAYARALLCEGRCETDLDACGSCEACRSFGKRNSFGLVELEARFDTASNVHKTLTKLSYSPLTRHRVIIIESSGKSRESEEAFLEALEMGRESTTFILLIDRLEVLDPATVSRCFPYRVKPSNAEGLGSDSPRKQ